ncbi:MAG: glycosyltransferase [Planctomycetes bacterium]|nr:glycosyltransferase [Planctomycetota bacterium]
MKSSLSLVIPVYNEEENLDELVDRCVAACDALGRPYEVVLVDDGSRDASRERIEAKARQFGGRVKGVFLNRNYGQHNAVICGLGHADGATVVTLDADLQNPPEEIGRLMAKVDEGYDVVGTVRVNRQDSLLRRLPSLLINRMVMSATGVMMHDYGCMLRAYDRRVVDAILECRERSTFVPVLANSFACRTTEIDVHHDERKAGTSKYGLFRLLNLMFDLMTSMTTAPLRMLTYAGGALSLCGIAFGAFLLAMRLLLGSEWAAQGIFTLFAVVFVLLGVQLVAMGLLGEFIGRIHIDVRQRPRYFVERIVGATGVRLTWSPEDAADEVLEHQAT